MICRACQRALVRPSTLARVCQSTTTRALSTKPTSTPLRSTLPVPSAPIRAFLPSTRAYSSAPAPTPSSASPSALEKPDFLDDAESWIWDTLAAEFGPVEMSVRDVSGGCGSMYAIDITSAKFRGAGMLKQQRMVNAVLGDKVKEWHGLQLRTKAP